MLVSEGTKTLMCYSLGMELNITLQVIAVQTLSSFFSVLGIEPRGLYVCSLMKHMLSCAMLFLRMVYDGRTVTNAFGNC